MKDFIDNKGLRDKASSCFTAKYFIPYKSSRGYKEAVPLLRHGLETMV